jgi:hypothetical protein
VSVYNNGANTTVIIVRCPSLFGSNAAFSFPTGAGVMSELDIKIPLNKPVSGIYTFELIDASTGSLIASTANIVISFGLEFVKE